MTAPPDPPDFDDLLDRMETAGSTDRVSFRDVYEHLGQRSFGVLLLVPALIALSPVGGIPGVPTVLAAVILLIAAQLIAGRPHFWLPRFILDRSVARGHLERAVEAMRPVLRFVDRFLCPRLTVLAGPLANRFIALFCILLVLTVPPLEFVPFGGTPIWVAIGAFGIGLTTKDGLLIVLGLAVALVSAAFAARLIL